MRFWKEIQTVLWKICRIEIKCAEHLDSQESECSIFLSELMFDKAYTNFQNCVIFLRDIRPYIPSENIPYFIKINPGGDFCAK